MSANQQPAPSAGALRAAVAIAGLAGGSRHDTLAAIIDRETGAAQLAEALKYALPYVEYRAKHPRSGVQADSARADVEIIRAALAAYEKGRSRARGE